LVQNIFSSDSSMYHLEMYSLTRHAIIIWLTSELFSSGKYSLHDFHSYKFIETYSPTYCVQCVPCIKNMAQYNCSLWWYCSEHLFTSSKELFFLDVCQLLKRMVKIFNCDGGIFCLSCILSSVIRCLCIALIFLLHEFAITKYSFFL
jgi:hypothetical protein